MRTFRSDNTAGLCPEALASIIEANDGSHQDAYGDDRYTEKAVEVFRELFGPRAHVGFVSTGTAGNTLAIASLTEPWQQVVCHGGSHYQADESTAPERITHCRTVGLHPGTTKLSPDDLAGVAAMARGDVHEPQPGVVTISNPTEFGTVYTPQETASLCEAAHRAGYRVHLDGARFANAVAFLGCDPRALTVEAGVDSLTFGGTKNGLACGEAVLFFPQGDGRAFERAAAAFPFHRKATGHLLSKHRFISAPFGATLTGGVWLEHAGHANAMAGRLAEGLRCLDLDIAYPTQVNSVFVRLPEEVDAALRASGHGYYAFPALRGAAPADAEGPRGTLFRLMCSFDTNAEDVRALLADAEGAISR